MSHLAAGIADLLSDARSDSRADWLAAVGQLALRSLSEPSASQAWRELLLSYHPELRLRGVYGLRNLASTQPEEVGFFVCQRLEEAETFSDPVLTQVLVQVASALPPQHQDRVFHQLARGREEARSAAVALLWNRALVEGPELLLRWTRDESPVVRSHLALVLCEKMPGSQAFEPLLRLARDAQKEVRAAVAIGMADLNETVPSTQRTSLELNPDYRQLQQLVSLQADLRPLQFRAAVPGEHALNSILHLTRELEQRSSCALQELTPWVRLAGSWQRLKTVADFARDPQVAWAARALSHLCRKGEASERVLGCLGVLQQAGNNPVLQEFALMCRCCMELLDGSDLSSLRDWSLRWKSRWESSGRVLRWAEFQGLADLLQASRPDLVSICDTSGMGPLPERELIEPALLHVQQVLSEQGLISAGAED